MWHTRMSVWPTDSRSVDIRLLALALPVPTEDLQVFGSGFILYTGKRAVLK